MMLWLSTTVTSATVGSPTTTLATVPCTGTRRLSLTPIGNRLAAIAAPATDEMANVRQAR
jgi:hypothetical protein